MKMKLNKLNQLLYKQNVTGLTHKVRNCAAESEEAELESSTSLPLHFFDTEFVLQTLWLSLSPVLSRSKQPSR